MRPLRLSIRLIAKLPRLAEPNRGGNKLSELITTLNAQTENFRVSLNELCNVGATSTTNWHSIRKIILSQISHNNVLRKRKKFTLVHAV